jgi:hypothetical protein
MELGSTTITGGQSHTAIVHVKALLGYWASSYDICPALPDPFELIDGGFPFVGNPRVAQMQIFGFQSLDGLKADIMFLELSLK